MSAMRIVVDDDLCQGHGVCESEAPDLFEVTRDRKVRVIDGSPSEDRRAAVEAAVRYCPTRALKVLDEGEGEQR
jgi:ferredoxin